MKPVIGVIGGIGSGKSMVAGLLSQDGGKVISGDLLGHEALAQPEIKRRITAEFGVGILGEDHQIDRQKLGRVVFADPARRHALEKIVFPWIEGRLRQLIESGRREDAVRFIVLDAAIMVETGWHKVCDHMVFVDAPREVRLGRVAQQRGWTASEVASRERAQMPLDEKRRWVDFEIDNSGPPEAARQQAAQLLRRLGLANGPEQA
jgi:dephospho-CoA kinase